MMCILRFILTGGFCRFSLPLVLTIHACLVAVTGIPFHNVPENLDWSSFCLEALSTCFSVGILFPWLQTSRSCRKLEYVRWRCDSTAPRYAPHCTWSMTAPIACTVLSPAEAVWTSCSQRALHWHLMASDPLSAAAALSVSTGRAED